MNNSANQSLTAQQIFDTIVSHLRSQGKKSLDEGGDCCYRGPGGLKCAVGCLIEDEEYLPQFEKKNVNFLYDNSTFSKLRNRLLPHFHLLADMQYIHDGCRVERWEWEFSEVAEKYKLTYSPA